MQEIINKIYNENCLDTLKRIKDDSIDLVITSPPYNMNLRIRNGKYCSRQIVKEFSTKYEGFDDNLPIDEFYDLHLNILNELLRTSSIIFYNIQIVTGSKRAFFKIIGELSDYLKDIIVWDKGYAQPAMAKRVFNRRTELLLIFDSKNAISRQFSKANFDRGTLDDIWNIKRGKKVVGSHSAVFPEELVGTIISNFSNEGDLIYDPFMGTGTTAVVAKKLNRNYLGSELTPKYFEIINKRLLELERQLF
ncbi:MAG: site-specific DNA-methyltransferase [Bacteroidetes bacterium]|nr:site-specific DNA-methyltransferase [Bacteroidota bacterium]